MMASKKELQEQIESLTFQRDAAKRDAKGAWERLRSRERAEFRRREDELRAKERESRRKHLDDLAAGRMDVKNATASAIVREDGQAYVELTFPLDKSELPIVQRVLDGAPGGTRKYAVEHDEAFISMEKVNRMLDQNFGRDLWSRVRLI